ncbi:diacylglycerol/lipid kinase family protein [Urechidicola croceus]|uniref:DAGKc domain-containing protein n=1 Tax=Urechidicola croceus TaxID=1850246 RepID=A0A1D8P958_9FLAO|nr:diacylglycerol kinase family protein [Urechidicola croceus]AOW21107.1 hypothetical protein LPB138_10640 [Urechidicola croceus]
MTDNWFVIINPTSGRGKFKKLIPKLLLELELNNIWFEFKITQYQKHAVDIARNAISKGYKNIISVGGDGTLHNVVNGIMSQSIVNTSDIKLAVIPIGTGNDWVKSYKIPRKFKKNIKIITQGNSIYQDIGKINFENINKPIYFNNIAGIGFDGYVVNRIKKYKKYGSLSYLIGSISGFYKYKPIPLKIEFNNKEFIEISFMTLIGLCKFSGGGMKLTKNPDPFDGLFEITIVKNISIFNLFKNLFKLFNGTIINHEMVENYKTNRIKITLIDESEPYIQADGEVLNTSDFEIELIPKAIQFIVP